MISRILTTLILAVFLTGLCLNASADMIITTTDGRTFTVPVNPNEVKAITYGPATPAQSSGIEADSSETDKPEASLPAPAKEIFNNWNKGGCSFTDQARFILRDKTTVTKLDIWYYWQSGETEVSYNVTGKDGEVFGGSFSKGSCDSNQKQWCQGIDYPNQELPKGVYTIKVANKRICQNAGSKNNGFVGVSTGGSAKAETKIDQSVNLSGKWKANWGPLDIRQEGNTLYMSYSPENGKCVVTQTEPGVFVGRWVEDKSSKRCADSWDGRHYWGKVRFRFKKNKSFIAYWDYCGNRKGGAEWFGRKID
jgi:hypothetical protein